MTILVELGNVVATSNALQTIEEVKGDGARMFTLGLLDRHVHGDWGDICEEDRGLNEAAILNGDRLMSVYKDGELTVWIITEADRSVTTVLLPEDY